MKNNKYKYHIIILLFINFISLNYCARLSVDSRLKNHYGITKELEHDKSSIKLYENALKDESTYVRLAAVKALGDFGKDASSSASKILFCTTDPNGHVRINSYIALSKILANKYMIPILTKGLNDRVSGVRSEVLKLIRSILQKDKTLADEQLLEALNNIRNSDELPQNAELAYLILQQLNIKLTQKYYNQLPENKTENNQNSIKINRTIKNQYTIAVSPIDLAGAPETAGIAINNRLYSELFKSHQFVVLERQKMEEILKEQGFQQTGCTTNECLVEMGKLLNVRLMIGGSVTKVNRLHSIDLRIIDVQTGEVVSVSTEDVMGSIEDVLLTGLKNSIAKLINNFSY